MNYKIFWLDDDPPHRLKRTQELLEKQGWKVSFFNDLNNFDKKNGAIHLLANKQFDLILLDQEIKCISTDYDYGDLWIGFVIFYWLRNQTTPPIKAAKAAKDLFNQLKYIEKKVDADNSDTPVFFITAYDDEHIKQAVRNCDSPNMYYVDKPIDRELLVSTIVNKLGKP